MLLQDYLIKMFCHSFCSLFLISYLLSWIKTSCQRHLLPYRQTNVAKKKKRKEGRKPTKVFSVQRLVKNRSIQFTDNSSSQESDLGSEHFLNQAFKMTTVLIATLIASLCETLSQKTQLIHIQIPDLQKLLEKNKCLLP